MRGNVVTLTPNVHLPPGLARRAPLIAGIALIVAAAMLYGFTLDDGLRLDELAGGDLITHQYAQVQGRVANAPGYPIYTMLGWLWFRAGRWLLPGLNATQVLSLFSTLWALAALGVLYALLLEISGRWPIALLVAGFYAVTYFFWYYAVTTEQYCSAVLQTLLFVLWALRWQRRREDRYLLYSAFNAGLCLSNLVTVLFIVPPLLWFYLSQEPALWRRGRLLLRMALLALLPLFSYAYVYYVGAAHPEWRGGAHTSAWAWFWNFISTGQGRSEMTWSLGPLTDEFPRLIAEELTPGVLILSLAGVAMLGRKRAIMLYATFIFYFIFGYIDRFGNWYQVLMPIYPLLLLGFGALLALAWRRLGRPARLPIVLALCLLVSARAVTNLPRANQSGRPDALAIPTAQAFVADDPPAGAWIYGTTEEGLALAYLTVIWGQRSDLQPVNTEQARRWLESAEAAPLYATRAAIGLLEAETGVYPPLWAAGAQLIEVLRQPRAELPAGVTRLDRDVYAGLRLAGAQWEMTPAGKLRASLYWQAVETPLPAASLSVRPTRAGDYFWLDDQALAQDHQPVWNAYSFDRWGAGEIVRDDYVIELPAGAKPDGLVIVLYRTTATGIEDLATLTLP